MCRRFTPARATDSQRRRSLSLPTRFRARGHAAPRRLTSDVPRRGSSRMRPSQIEGCLGRDIARLLPTRGPITVALTRRDEPRLVEGGARCPSSHFGLSAPFGERSVPAQPKTHNPAHTDTERHDQDHMSDRGRAPADRPQQRGRDDATNRAPSAIVPNPRSRTGRPRRVGGQIPGAADGAAAKLRACSGSGTLFVAP